jgi:hypothetical protein
MPAPAQPPFRPTLYSLLKVSSSATPQQLRQAFRSLSKLYHPDTTSLPSSEAAEAFRQVQAAYALLNDPSRRLAYDRQLAAAAPGAPPRQAPSTVGPAAPGDPTGPRLARPLPVRRALSGGEWFALLLLAVALVLSLVLGIGVAWARGAELMRQPSWWPPGPVLGPGPTELLADPAAEPLAVPLQEPAAGPLS